MAEKMDTDDNSITRESILKLIEEKDNIEKTLRELKEILDGNNIGMTEDLVDSDGFPRQDIDVYQVRHARHKIICLQNDHKAIMKKIEECLHALHAQTNLPSAESDQSTSHGSNVNTPIAKVNLVHPESPAGIAGLQVDDIITQFGTVNINNFKSLQDIGNLVQHSVGRKITVRVKRNEQFINLNLIPKEWSGRGLLGCNILPIENVDR